MTVSDYVLDCANKHYSKFHFVQNILGGHTLPLFCWFNHFLVIRIFSFFSISSFIVSSFLLNFCPYIPPLHSVINHSLIRFPLSSSNHESFLFLTSLKSFNFCTSPSFKLFFMNTSHSSTEVKTFSPQSPPSTSMT